MIRLDATIVIAHSDKEQAKGTFKGSYGHHPLTAWCDNTGESLAVLLRPGNAGSNTAADHIAVTGTAIAQIPARYRRKMLITCDGAGSTHALVDHVTALNARRGCQVHYSAGLDFDERIRSVLPDLPEPAWSAAPGGGRHGPSGRAGRGADRAAAPLRRRRPLREVARGHADPGPPREPAPRRAAVPVRAAREQAVPGHRHQHPGQPGPVPLSTPPDPGPRRGQDPLRQGHRPAAPPVQELPGQHRLVPGRVDRLRPARLAPAARPRRRPRQSRAENPALQDPPRRRADRQKPAPPLPADTTVLALGPRHLPGIHPDHGPATAMSWPPRPSYQERRPPAGRGTGAHPTRQPCRHPTPRTEKPRSKLIPPGHQASASHP